MRKLYCTTWAPRLYLWIDYFSTNYAIYLLSTAPNYTLRYVFGNLSSLYVRIAKIISTVLTLEYLFYILIMILPSDSEIEGWTTSSPSVTFHFHCIAILDKLNDPHLHVSSLSTFPPDTLVLYTDGSKLDTGNCKADWALMTVEPPFKNGPTYTSGNYSLGIPCEIYDAELNAISQGLIYL